MDGTSVAVSQAFDSQVMASIAKILIHVIKTMVGVSMNV
jgi:hypothetical protein